MCSWAELSMLAPNSPASSSSAPFSLLSLLWFRHLLILLQSQVHKGRRQSALWGVWASEPAHAWGPGQAMWGLGQPRAGAMSVPALPLTLLFWKWVCCHSNCQVPSVICLYPPNVFFKQITTSQTRDTAALGVWSPGPHQAAKLPSSG